MKYLFCQDDIMNSDEVSFLGEKERAQIRELFSQGIKHKMKMNFVRQMSKTSGLNLKSLGSLSY